jgi:serine/threonine protein kinase
MLSLRLNPEPRISDVLQHQFNPVDLKFIYENTSSDEHLYTYKLDNTIVKISHDTYASQRLIKELENYTYLYSVLSDSEMKYFIPNVTGGTFRFGEYKYTYITMPYIDGSDLLTFFQSGPDQKKIYMILKEIAQGLLILSKHGLSHGDMHAGNVLVTGNMIKIIDFDSASKTQEARNRNFIDKGGFFTMCQYFITDPILKEKINTIRLAYISNTVHSDAVAQTALESFIKLVQQGGRRKTARRKKRSLA